MKYLIFLSLLLLMVCNTFAQHNRFEDNNSFIEINYYKNTGGEYYDSEGNGIHYHMDSTTYPGYTRDYTYELSHHVFNIKGGYQLLNKLDIIGGINLDYYILNENFITDTLAGSGKRAELSTVRLDQFLIGADYYLYKTENFIKLNFIGKIPFSQNDTDVAIENNTDFLSSSPYEIMAGIKAGAFVDKFYFDADFNYNYRSGEFSDLAIAGITLALASVENTMLRLKLKYVYSLEKSDNQYFNIRQMVTNPTYLDAGFGFWARFSDNYYGSFDYKIRPIGENVWNSGTIEFALGINFNVK